MQEHELAFANDHYQAHVEATFEAAHANGPEGHKCHEMHGHSWMAEIDFEYGRQALDDYGWGPDFGRVKDLIRNLDHRNLNDWAGAMPPSAENIASWLAHAVLEKFEAVEFVRVTLHEGRGNQIRVQQARPEYVADD